jgi:hypothetical protein
MWTTHRFVGTLLLVLGSFFGSVDALHGGNDLAFVPIVPVSFLGITKSARNKPSNPQHLPGGADGLKASSVKVQLNALKASSSGAAQATNDRRKLINSVSNNVRVPRKATYDPSRLLHKIHAPEAITNFVSKIPTQGYAVVPTSVSHKQDFDHTRKTSSAANSELFSVLALLRKNTPAMDNNFDEKVVFHKKPDATLFYQTLDAPVKEAGILLAYYVLKDAPPLVTGVYGSPDFEELYGDKILPFGRMMIANDPEDCFLRQTSAFCSPEPKSPKSGRVVCDLDYLNEYETKNKDRVRYGGRAVVQGGKIVEISGVTQEDGDFPRKKRIFLSSFAIHVVVVRHAIMTHLAICQRLLVKLTTNRSPSYQKAFEQNPGPSLLFQALTYRTNEVSINEQLLIGAGT